MRSDSVETSPPQGEPPRGEGTGSELSRELLDLLAAYDTVGIVSREHLRDIPPARDPVLLLPGYRSAIVLARVPREPAAGRAPGKFHQALNMLAAQVEAVRRLSERGYRTHVLGSRTTFLSLPRLAERAGVGELSPFHTLAVQGHGLRAVLSAILTDAPLETTPPAQGACPHRQSCLKRCPALGPEGRSDRARCTSCGACVARCTAA